MAPCSISHQFQTMYYFLSNSFFQRIYVYIFRAFFRTQAENAPFICLFFTCCLFSRLELVLFQLLSLLFGIHSLSMLSYQIAQFLSVVIWYLTFSDSLILLEFPRHLITVDELCIVPGLWVCPTPVPGAPLISFFQILALYKFCN